MPKKVTIPVVEQLKAEIADQPGNALRPGQVQELKDERDRVAAIASAPHWVPGDRSAANSRLRQIDDMLGKQAPKLIDKAERRDKVSKLANQVLGEVIAPSLLTRAEMRRNPTGAVDHFLHKGEGHPAVKEAILTWKRALRGLEPENDESDYTNVERFRREGVGPGASTFMSDAQIPGNFAMSNLAKANWPLGEPTADTAFKQTKRREVSEAMRAGLEKARAARQAKKAAKAAEVVDAHVAD